MNVLTVVVAIAAVVAMTSIRTLLLNRRFTRAFGFRLPLRMKTREEVRPKVVEKLEEVGRGARLDEIGLAMHGVNQAPGAILTLLNLQFGIDEQYAKEYEQLLKLALLAGFPYEVVREAEAGIDAYIKEIRTPAAA